MAEPVIAEPPTREPLLEARGVTKHYGHVLALDGANF